MKKNNKIEKAFGVDLMVDGERKVSFVLTNLPALGHNTLWLQDFHIEMIDMNYTKGQELTVHDLVYFMALHENVGDIIKPYIKNPHQQQIHGIFHTIK